MKIVNSKKVLQFLTHINLHLDKPHSTPELMDLSQDWIRACQDWKVTDERFKAASDYLVFSCHFFPKLPDFLKALDETWSQNQSHPKAIEDKSSGGLFSKEQVELNKKGIKFLAQVVEGKISLSDALSHFPVYVTNQEQNYDSGPSGPSNHIFGGKPYIPTSRMPEDILDSDEDLFKRHFELWQKCDGQPGQIRRSFSEQELSRVSEINDQLFENGFRVAGISASDQLEWSLVSELHPRP